MRFLLDANLPRSAASLFANYGHDALDARDLFPDGTSDKDIARHAKEYGLVLVTRDFDFADIRNYPPAAYAGIVVLDLPDDAVAAIVVKALESFLKHPDLVKRLPGRLAIVELWRVRFRNAS